MKCYIKNYSILHSDVQDILPVNTLTHLPQGLKNLFLSTIPSHMSLWELLYFCKRCTQVYSFLWNVCSLGNVVYYTAIFATCHVKLLCDLFFLWVCPSSTSLFSLRLYISLNSFSFFVENSNNRHISLVMVWTTGQLNEPGLEDSKNSFVLQDSSNIGFSLFLLSLWEMVQQ